MHGMFAVFGNQLLGTRDVVPGTRTGRRMPGKLTLNLGVSRA